MLIFKKCAVTEQAESIRINLKNKMKKMVKKRQLFPVETKESYSGRRTIAQLISTLVTSRSA